ncbi:MAG TPA: hypothetical protein PKE64_13620, partial [Anaerolineae bacterium]|nr:hypothetical protein [Anaerolineae bacterium]
RTTSGSDPRTRPGGSAVAKRDLLVGVRLLTGVTAHLHCSNCAAQIDQSHMKLGSEARGLVARWVTG